MSSQVPAGAAPTVEESRISALDVARGVALCGILLMNITGFGLPYAYGNPTNAGGSTGADLWAWITTEMLFEGTQRGLFTLLFGAGIVLLTRSLESSGRPNAGDHFFRRNLWLVVFGIVHAYLLLWVGEILFYYGVTALFVYGLRNAKTKTLLTLAIGGLVLSTAWTGLETYNGLKAHREFVTADSVKTAGDSLTNEQTDAIKAWEGRLSDFKPDSAKIAKAITTKQGSYWDILKFQAPRVVREQQMVIYRYFFDFFSMMLFGIVLFRAGIVTAQASTRTYLVMILAGYTVGLFVNYYEVRTIIDGEFGLLAYNQAGITYDVGRIAMTIGHLGVLMLFARGRMFGWLRSAFAAVGRMAFTNYIATSVICAFVFYGFGFGLFGELRRHQLYYVVGAIWLFQLIVSPLWLSRYRFGPLEWLWRWLTYGDRPAMRRQEP